jgi:hypothetical protein
MKEEEEEILEGWKHFLKSYVSYAQPSFNYIKSLNYVDPNA